MSLTPEQLEQRLQGITATDISAIVGCNPWVAPIQCYRGKIGQDPPRSENVKTRWGQKLEGPIREDFAERHGWRCEERGTIANPRKPWILATPDALNYERFSVDPHSGTEIKVHDREAVIFGNLEYGAQGTDEVPPHELLQSVWGMDATDLNRWYLVPFLGGAPREYIIDRDDELIGMLEEEGERFLVDHVRPRKPPPPDGSKAWTAWLQKRWEKHNLDLIWIDDGSDEMAMISQLRELAAQAADIHQRIEKSKQEIKEVIGEFSGLEWKETGRKSAKVTWKRSKDSVKPNYQPAFEAMKTQAAMLASAYGPMMQQAVRILTSMNASLTNGDDSIDTAKLAEVILLCVTTITAFATIIPPDKIKAGSRRLIVPRWWKKPPEKSNSDDSDGDDSDDNSDTPKEN